MTSLCPERDIAEKSRHSRSGVHNLSSTADWGSFPCLHGDVADRRNDKEHGIEVTPSQSAPGEGTQQRQEYSVDGVETFQVVCLVDACVSLPQGSLPSCCHRLFWSGDIRKVARECPMG